MGDNTGIEWTDASWTPIRARHRATGKIGWHCVHASEGCRNCYSETFNRRLGTGLAFKPQLESELEIFLDQDMLTQPLRWKRPRKIFVCSMTDLFADFVPDAMIDAMFAVMALCPQHTFQVLTKRPDRMRAYMSDPEREALWMNAVAETIETQSLQHAPILGRIEPRLPLPNVWLGTSAERQAEADERIPELLATPAAVRFVSLEPLIGPIRLSGTSGDRQRQWNWLTGETGVMYRDGPDFDQGPKLNWVIVGGESGPKARPMHPDWLRSLRDQCAATGVAFFFKQWGAWTPTWGSETHLVYRDGRVVQGTHDHPDAWKDKLAEPIWRRGKKAAGHTIDGVVHQAFPERWP